MDYIHRLPFLLGGFVAVIVGAISYAYGSGSQTTYLRMAVVMVLFYLIGLYIRGTLKAINKELELKRVREEQEQEEQERINLQNEKNNKSNANNAQYPEQHRENQQEHKINLVAEDQGEDFSPMTVNRVISNKIKE